MAKWNVHFGIRLTYNVKVEADSYEEAVKKATPEWENVDYAAMGYADQDVDAWEEK